MAVYQCLWTREKNQPFHLLAAFTTQTTKPGRKNPYALVGCLCVCMRECLRLGWKLVCAGGQNLIDIRFFFQKLLRFVLALHPSDFYSTSSSPSRLPRPPPHVPPKACLKDRGGVQCAWCGGKILICFLTSLFLALSVNENRCTLASLLFFFWKKGRRREGGSTNFVVVFHCGSHCCCWKPK